MRLMRSLLLSLLLLLSGTIAFAASHSQQYFQDKKGQNIILSYFQSDMWVLNHIRIRPGKMQEMVESRTFKTKQDLNRYKSLRFKNVQFTKSKPTQSITTEVRNKTIWKVINKWDIDWELKFADWVKQNFNADYFVDNNLETDCADVAFALRWIFARDNNLPAANTLAGSLAIFSHESVKSAWAHLPTAPRWQDDKLFLAALRYLMRHAYTKTLLIDGYPFKLTTENFLEGTIHLDGGHTMIISKIDRTGVTAPIWKLSSTVPAAVRVLSEEVMLDLNITRKEKGGLYRMRWPEQKNGRWYLIPKDKMPLFSEEQYTEEFKGEDKSFTLALIKRLNIPFIPKNIVKLAMDSVTDYLKMRIQVVEDGFNFCKTNDCSEGTMNYEDHSTPTRDKRLYSKFVAVDGLINQLKSFDPSLPQFWTEYKNGTIISIENIDSNLSYFEELFKFKIPSYHPDDTIEERWALTEDALKSAFTKKTERVLYKRELLVKDSKFCIGNDKCIRGTLNWKNLNTFKLDQGLKKEIFYTANHLEKNMEIF